MIIKCKSAIPSRFCHCVPIFITHNNDMTTYRETSFYAFPCFLGTIALFWTIEMHFKSDVLESAEWLPTHHLSAEQAIQNWMEDLKWVQESPAIYLIKYFLCHCPVKWIRNEQSSSVSSQNIDWETAKPKFLTSILKCTYAHVWRWRGDMLLFSFFIKRQWGEREGSKIHSDMSVESYLPISEMIFTWFPKCFTVVNLFSLTTHHFYRHVRIRKLLLHRQDMTV